jgi:hypothetical protein
MGIDKTRGFRLPILQGIVSVSFSFRRIIKHNGH